MHPSARVAKPDARLDKGSAIGSVVSVTKEYRPWTPEQSFLLPPSPMDWLPEGHLACVVLELVRDLDVSAIGTQLGGCRGRKRKRSAGACTRK